MTFIATFSLREEELLGSSIAVHIFVVILSEPVRLTSFAQGKLRGVEEPLPFASVREERQS
jgi:hypothetical protein